jgi:1,4-dihydroxy-2-naphthoate octaprenyltransferase
MVWAPVSAGAALAFQRGAPFHPLFFLVALAGGAAAHLGANVINDFYDGRAGVDKLARIDRGAITTASDIVESGQASVRNFIGLANELFGVALGFGIFLTVERGWGVLIFSFAGFLLAWQYWAPPLKYGYRGLGPVGAFSAYGIVAVLGSYYVQAGKIVGAAWWAAVVPGLLAAMIVFTHDMLHPRSDKAAGKMTPAARLGPENTLIAAGSIITLAYVALALQVAFGLFPWWTLAALITALPVAGAWARAFRDPVAQNCLNLFGAVLGASVLVSVTIALSLAFAR